MRRTGKEETAPSGAADRLAYLLQALKSRRNWRGAPGKYENCRDLFENRPGTLKARTHARECRVSRPPHSPTARNSSRPNGAKVDRIRRNLYRPHGAYQAGFARSRTQQHQKKRLFRSDRARSERAGVTRYSGTCKSLTKPDIRARVVSCRAAHSCKRLHKMPCYKSGFKISRSQPCRVLFILW